MKKNRVGICHICGNHKELTFEHIPPKSVFNADNVRLYQYIDIHAAGNDCWDFSGVRYKQHQRGVGGYTLCEQCNNDIGAWYVVDYADFIIRLYSAIKKHSFKQNDEFVVYANDIYPLRIFKSILAMFCSLNSDKFVDMHNIRKMLLNREEKGVAGDYGIAMYFAIGNIIKQLPISVIASTDTHNFTSTIRTVSEITWFPFGYIFDAKRENNPRDFDITDFSQYGYDEKADISIELITREVNTPFPVDFRSKKQVIEQRNATLSAKKGETSD